MKTRITVAAWIVAAIFILLAFSPLAGAQAYDFMAGGLAYKINDDGDGVTITLPMARALKW